MAIVTNRKIEFDLVIREYGIKNEDDFYGSTYDPLRRKEKEQELEVKTEIKLNSIDAKKVLQQLMDYLQSI